MEKMFMNTFTGTVMSETKWNETFKGLLVDGWEEVDLSVEKRLVEVVWSDDEGYWVEV